MTALLIGNWQNVNLMLLGMYVAAVADVAMAVGVWVLIYKIG